MRHSESSRWSGFAGASPIRTVWVALPMLMLGLSTATAGTATDTPPNPAVDAAPPIPGPRVRLAQLRRRVESVLVYPERARRRGLTGEVRLEFQIGPLGQPLGLRVVRSSGSFLLDEAARNAVVTAAPLPHLYGLLEIPVIFSLDVSQKDDQRSAENVTQAPKNGHERPTQPQSQRP